MSYGQKNSFGDSKIGFIFSNLAFFYFSKLTWDVPYVSLISLFCVFGHENCTFQWHWSANFLGPRRGASFFPAVARHFFNSHFQDVPWTASQEHRKILLQKDVRAVTFGECGDMLGGGQRERENLWNSTRLFNCDHMKLRLLNAWSQEANICLGSEAELFTLWK